VCTSVVWIRSGVAQALAIVSKFLCSAQADAKRAGSSALLYVSRQSCCCESSRRCHLLWRALVADSTTESLHNGRAPRPRHRFRFHVPIQIQTTRRLSSKSFNTAGYAGVWVCTAHVAQHLPTWPSTCQRGPAFAHMAQHLPTYRHSNPSRALSFLWQQTNDCITPSCLFTNLPGAV